MNVKRLVLISLIFFLIPLHVFSAPPSDPERRFESTEPFYYVALGDSISVGYEPGMTETSIPYGYVDRLYEQALFHHRTEVQNYGILGITSKGLSQYVEAVINQSSQIGRASCRERV